MKLHIPSIIKGYYGAMGRNVFLARSSDDLVRIIKRNVSSGSSVLLRIREHIRRFKHHGYQRDSFYRGRFIVQKFIPGLNNDWKVYFFGGRGYVFNRPVFPEREFRASGGGYDNYRYGRRPMPLTVCLILAGKSSGRWMCRMFRWILPGMGSGFICWNFSVSILALQGF